MKRIGLLLVCLFLLTLGACAKKPTSASLQPPPPAASAEAPQTETMQEAPVTEPTAPAAVSVTASDGSQLETVYFDYDSFTLTAAARAVLERNARWLKENPAVTVTIEGHCDERGSDEYNLALGERRAQAVRNYLAALGVGAERLATVSYGEERPAVAGHDESAWTKNRRAAFK
jgi:peptidoglycan-associated lipoprotein